MLVAVVTLKTLARHFAFLSLLLTIYTGVHAIGSMPHLWADALWACIDAVPTYLRFASWQFLDRFKFRFVSKICWWFGLAQPIDEVAHAQSLSLPIATQPGDLLHAAPAIFFAVWFTFTVHAYLSQGAGGVGDVRFRMRHSDS